MLIRWLQQIFTGRGAAPAASQKAGRGAAKPDAAGRHLAHEAVKADAHRLAQLVQAGLPAVRRKRNRRRVKSQVTRVLAPEFNDVDLVDEITERIAAVAEVDPYYRKLFVEEKPR